MEEFSGSESHGGSAVPGAESEVPKDAKAFGGANVGDLIQWQNGGTLQFQQPKRVRLVSEDGQWVCVEDSETGIPMTETIVEDRAAASPPPPPPRFPFATPPLVNAPLAGEVEWMRNKVGKETNVRLMVTGEIGAKEIGRLIKLLEAQRAVLEEDDEE